MAKAEIQPLLEGVTMSHWAATSWDRQEIICGGVGGAAERLANVLSQSHWEATYRVSVRLTGILPAGMLLKFLDQFLLGVGETCCVLVRVSAQSECRSLCKRYPVSSWQPSIAGKTTEFPNPEREAPSSFCSSSLYWRSLTLRQLVKENRLYWIQHY